MVCSLSVRPIEIITTFCPLSSPQHPPPRVQPLKFSSCRNHENAEPSCQRLETIPVFGQKSEAILAKEAGMQLTYISPPNGSDNHLFLRCLPQIEMTITTAPSQASSSPRWCRPPWQASPPPPLLQPQLPSGPPGWDQPQVHHIVYLFTGVCEIMSCIFGFSIFMVQGHLPLSPSPRLRLVTL